MRKEPLSAIFDKCPKEALEEAFLRFRERSPWGQDTIWAWQWTTGIDGVGYGSFRHVTREELDGRMYEIELCDYDIGIHWTDTVFNPHGCKHIQKEIYYAQ